MTKNSKQILVKEIVKPSPIRLAETELLFKKLIDEKFDQMRLNQQENPSIKTNNQLYNKLKKIEKKKEKPKKKADPLAGPPNLQFNSAERDRHKAGQIAAYIMNNYDNKPISFPQPFSLGDTARLSVRTIFDIQWEQTTANDQTQEYFNLFGFREPLCAYTYTLSGSKTASQVSTYRTTDIRRNLQTYNTGYYGIAKLVSGTDVHGPVVYPGQSILSGGKYFYPIGCRDRVSIDFGFTTTTFPTGCQLFVYTVEQIEPLYRYPLTTTNFTFTSYTSSDSKPFQYLSFVLITTSALFSDIAPMFSLQVNGGTISITNTNVTQCYPPVTADGLGVPNSQTVLTVCQRALPGIDDHISAIDQMQIISFNAKLTNTSNKLTLNGTRTGYQIPGSEFWMDYIANDKAQSANRAVTDTAAKGGYSWLALTQPYDVNFLPVNGPNGSCVCFNLDSLSDSIIMSLNVPYSSQGCGRSFIATIDFGFEFKTDSMWWEKQSQTSDSVTGDLVRNILSRAPQHMENPLHMADIHRAINKVLGLTVKYAPMVAKGAAALLAL